MTPRESKVLSSSKIKIILLFFLFYQYILHIVVNLVGGNEELKKYLQYISPYVFLIFFNIIYLQKKIIKNDSVKVLHFFLFILFTFCFVFQFVRHSDDTYPIQNAIKSFQFFYGILIVFSGAISLIRMSSSQELSELILSFIKTSLLLVSLLTIFEFLIVNTISNSKEFFLYKNIYIPHNEAASIVSKPIGVALYAQPNAVYIAYLLIIYNTLSGKKDINMLVGVLGLGASMGGTGILIFLVYFLLINLGIYNLFFPLIFYIFYILAQHIEMLGAKISVDYWIFLIENFWEYFNNIFRELSISEYLFGVSEFKDDYHPGFTHDWAFLDIAHEGGSLGLILFVLVYFFILKYAFSYLSNKTFLWFTVIYIAVISNFHYSSLNFYFGQFLFGILGALMYCNKSRANSY